MARARPSPRRAACFCFHLLARALARKNRQAASAKAQLVVLGLAAVAGLQVQGVSRDEGDLLLGTPVSEPVPGEHPHDADDQAVPEGCDGLEEGIRSAREVTVEDDGAGVVE